MGGLLTRPGLWIAGPAWICFLPLWGALLVWPLPLSYCWVIWGLTAFVCLALDPPRAGAGRSVVLLALVLSALGTYYGLAWLNRPVPQVNREAPLLVLSRVQSDWGDSAVLLDRNGSRWQWYNPPDRAEPGLWVTGTIQQAGQSDSQRKILLGRRLQGVITVKQPRIFEARLTWQARLAHVRWHLHLRFSVLPRRMRTLANAVYLGYRDVDGAEDYRRWGAAHFLAVSGWHVGMVLLFCSVFFGTGFWGVSATAVTLGIYILLGGAGFSAVRAFFLALVCLAGRVFDHRSGGLNALAVALVGTLIYWPAGVFSLSWQLSALATALVMSLPVRRPSGFLATAALLWFVPAPLAAPISGGLFASTLPLSLFFPLFSLLFTLAWLCSLPFVLNLPFAGVFVSFGEVLLSIWDPLADFWTGFLPKAYIPAPWWLPAGLGLTAFFVARRLSGQVIVQLGAGIAMALATAGLGFLLEVL